MRNDYFYKNILYFSILLECRLELRCEEIRYIPEQNLTVDESMIKSRRRRKMKAYMPLKPIKYGFKAYILAESSSGYMLNWKMHEGKKLQ